MNLEQIQTLLAYDSWANRKMIDAVQPLGSEKLRRDLSTSLGSILGTLVHIVGAEEVWLRRWQDNPRKGILSIEDIDHLSTLEKRWTEIESERDDFVSQLNDEKLNQIHKIKTMSGRSYEHRLWEMVQHVANHSSYHRGQIVTMLRQLGHSAPATDLIVFYREPRN